MQAAAIFRRPEARRSPRLGTAPLGPEGGVHVPRHLLEEEPGERLGGDRRRGGCSCLKGDIWIDAPVRG